VPKQLMHNEKILAFFFFFSLAGIFLISLCIGRYPVPFSHAAGIIASKFFSIRQFWAEEEEAVILFLRLPRILLGLLIGAGLGISGAAFQGIFRNPLVSPHILGVAAGAGFGGILAMLVSNNSFLVMVSAFAFGIVSISLTSIVGRVRKTSHPLALVLSGIVVGAFFTALISLLKFVADPVDRLPSIVFWLMGNLAGASFAKFSIVSVPILVAMTLLVLLRWRINILSLGDEEARTLGTNPEKLRWLIILCVTVIVALSVSVSGIIGWVGLVIPHIARFAAGANHRILLPLSAYMGAGYLVIMDDIARSLTPAEIPLGILTAIIGAVVFAAVLKHAFQKNTYGN